MQRRGVPTDAGSRARPRLPVTGIDEVHAVVGGIHLAAAPDAVIAKTADAFGQIQSDYFVFGG